MEFLTRIFDDAGFPSRWQCGAGWKETPWLGWLHILSDLGVWGAYLAIPLVLVYFSWRRKDLPFRKIFLLFGAFIVACGTTHLIEAIIFWWPVYRLAGVIKLLTALVSWATVVALFRVVPGALTMRAPEELEREIAARRLAEQNLLRSNAELEQRVLERTAELTLAVTELKEERERLRGSASELEEAAAKLSQADRSKDEFLATLAHELRNPLAPLRNGLQIMRISGGKDASVNEARIMMERQLGQLVRLVDDLLDVSRISRGKLDLRKQPVNLQDALRNAEETSRTLIASRGQTLTLQTPPNPILVEADLIRLGQVFANLLNNAAKYSGQNGRIWLTAECTPNEVSVSIKDNGVGIPPEMLPKVFDVFTQVDRSLERSQGGLGIGLSVVKRLVEMHGGTVTAHSEGLGRGSEFVVRLPLLHASSSDLQPASETAEATFAITGRRILVVDDNLDAAASLALLLKMAGNEVQAAHDGAAAVEQAEAFRPDIILLDIGLPKLNGYDVCRAIRKEPWGTEITIVALTGWGQEEDRRKSREAGFNGHLTKPVDFAALIDLLAAPRES